MDIGTMLSSTDLAITRTQVDTFNKALTSPAAGQSLDKDDFLKLLITQLTHQDPTEPMNDREFIAQMAQFSTLEQITNMNAEFGQLAGILSNTQALGMLGKTVEIIEGDSTITGVVEEVSGREFPRVYVNGRFYDFERVQGVKE